MHAVEGDPGRDLRSRAPAPKPLVIGHLRCPPPQSGPATGRGRARRRAPNDPLDQVWQRARGLTGDTVRRGGGGRRKGDWSGQPGAKSL